jgi:2-polyprenyl-6-methoxyphenol hydroxylase-like FAD-dependent oxidoreductase
MISSHPEVLVAGAGPVGMYAALALAKQGVAVGIVDSALQPATHSYALALHPRSVHLLKAAGLYESVMAESYLVHRAGLYDQNGRRAEFTVGDGNSGSALAVLRQDVLEEYLEAALADVGVEVLWSHRLSRAVPGEDHVSATIEALEKESRGYAVAHTEWIVADSKDMRPRFIIGADGHSSWVRRTLRIGFPEVARPQYFAVFEFASDADLDHEMRIVFAGGTTNVVWPVAENQIRCGFELLSYPARRPGREKDRFAVQVDAGEYPILTEERLRTLLAERAPWFTGSVGEITWRIVVRFERRLAESFGRDRMWLAGDAAHLTGPAGVQSMNSGLAEASDLANIMSVALGGRGSGEGFAEYEQTYRGCWSRLLGLSGTMQGSATADPWVVEHAASLLPCLPGIGNEAADLARQLGLAFGRSSGAGA